MIILDLLVYVCGFFLNPYQWGFRGLFSKYEGTITGGTPIPLSLYLFVLGMDVLSRLVNKDMEGNFLSGCKIGGVREEEELEVSHLLYANDTLLFCKDNPDQLVCLGWILMWFEALSGLKINLSYRREQEY